MGVSLTQTLLYYGADIVSIDLVRSAPKDVWHPLIDVANKTGSRVTYISCDVTSEESVAKTFEEAEAQSRFPLRGLVTCAGISGKCPAVDYPVGAFRKILDINVTGTFLCATAAARIMHRQMVGGSIVMFASMSGTNVNRVSLADSNLAL